VCVCVCVSVCLTQFLFYDFFVCFRNSVSSHSGSGSGVQNRIGDGGAQSEPKTPAAGKVRDIRQLLEEKRQGHRTAVPLATAGKMGI